MDIVCWGDKRLIRPFFLNSYTIRWTPTASEFYIDGEHRNSFSDNVPVNIPSKIIYNNWVSFTSFSSFIVRELFFEADFCLALPFHRQMEIRSGRQDLLELMLTLRSSRSSILLSERGFLNSADSFLSLPLSLVPLFHSLSIFILPTVNSKDAVRFVK